MHDWINVVSSRASAVAYDRDEHTIYVRFRDGVVYRYDSCSPEDWSGLTAPGTSIGRYISRVLDRHPYGPVQQ